MTSYVPTDLRRFVETRADHLCEYCLIHESDTFLGCQVDHIRSEKHGGATSEDNLALACTACNRAKGTDIGSLADDGQLCRLFDPRKDRWFDHFSLSGVRIEPRTSVGQATVRILQLNVLHRLLERQALIIAARYPTAAARSRMMEQAE